MTIYNIMQARQQQAFDKISRRRDVEDEQWRISRAEKRAAERQAKQSKVAASQQRDTAGRMENMYRELLNNIGSGTNTALTAARDDLTAATADAKRGLEPWRKAGTDALGQLQEKISAGPGEFEESPGYQFRLAEGQKAIERSAAARGGALSGAAMKAGMRYGQDFATNDYDNFLRRYYESMSPLERMSGQGMEAAKGMGEFGLSGASRLGELSLSGINQENDARFRATQGMAGAAQYGGESLAGGTTNAANIMAAQDARRTQRDVAYNTWKLGESTLNRDQGMWGYT